MAGNLKEILASIKSDMSGSRASNRFEYQQGYAICCLIELHTQQKDYRILFDYYDDIVVLLPSDEPSEMHFYQVKTNRTKNWTLTNLLSKPKKTDGSISVSKLGRMFSHLKHFAEYTASLNFVSNANFNFNLKDKTESLGKNQIFLIDLAQTDYAKVKKKISKEIGIDIKDEIANITVFKVSSLSLDDHCSHILGKLTDFLIHKFGEDDPPAQSLFRVLSKYVKKKQDWELPPNSLPELFENKSLSYSEVEDILQSISFKKKFARLWQEISNALANENCNYRLLQKLNDECDRYLLERTNPTNDTLQNVRREIKHLLSDEAIHQSSLLSTLDMVAQKLPASSKTIRDLYNDTFFKAMVLIEIYDN